MKIKTLKFAVLLLLMVSVFISCGDDDDTSFTFIERDRTEQQLADSDSLINYLSTHYYNSSFFETVGDHKYTDIIITELGEGETSAPDGHTLLIDAVGEPLTTTHLDTDYEYYILRLNQGLGEAPKFTDRVFVRYEGVSVNSGETFDIISSPTVFNLQGNLISTQGVIRAWQLVMPTFNTSSGFSLDNGVVNYQNFGLGIMFIPSGLGYFSGVNTGESYDNLMFKFELLRHEQEDHDSDGIPSYIEDRDGNIDVTDDDTDEDNFPNFIDLDDDGDDVITADEIISKTYSEDEDMMPFLSEMTARDYFENNAAANEILVSIDFDSVDSNYIINTIIIVDSNNDGTPDYLDENITINYNEDEE